jgi:hypothetical protein
MGRGLAPPWWPTGREAWWGSQGGVQAHQGVPLYRKPHDLKKAWNISLLSAVIKHMSPRFDQMRKLVWQSKRLQQKMSAEDTDTWSMILQQEEVLSRRLKTSLQITPLDDDDQEQEVDVAQQNKRKRELISGPSRDISAEELAVVLPPEKGGFPVDDLVKLVLQLRAGERRSPPGVRLLRRRGGAAAATASRGAGLSLRHCRRGLAGRAVRSHRELLRSGRRRVLPDAGVTFAGRG